MKVFKKSLTNIALAIALGFGGAVAGVNGVISAIRANAETTALENEFTNHGQFAVDYYLENSAFAYTFADGATEGLPAGYTGAVLKIASAATGGAPYINVDFTASQIEASMVESVVARVYSPDYTAADELRINNTSGTVGGAGAYDLTTWCDVALPIATITGADGNLGSFAFGLRDKGTISDYFYIDSITVTMKETTKVTFTHVNSLWNNYAYDNAYCTFLQFDGGISGNGGLDADFSRLLAAMTVDGQPADMTAVSFYCPNWIGANGGIIMRWAHIPVAGTKMVIPAGTTFDIGGADTNIYEITKNITLTSNGATWEAPAMVSYTVLKVTDPYEAETLTTCENGDGTITYTLPEYTRAGKVLLGYVENRTVDGTVVQRFLPAGEYTTNATDLIFIALWGEFTTMDGASIRIASAETSGIRWTTNIDAEGFNNIIYWTQGRYAFGTELSADGFGENFDIATKTWKVENSQYTGVLIDINSQYYNTAFTARGYVDITYSNGATKRIYATANDTTRSIAQVANLAIASGEYTGMQLSILEEIAGV
jgi:hypothetical protein